MGGWPIDRVQGDSVTTGEIEMTQCSMEGGDRGGDSTLCSNSRGKEGVEARLERPLFSLSPLFSSQPSHRRSSTIH